MPGEKILIVDDDPHIRMLLKDRLEASGYEALQAENGVQAVELATKEDPDLVLLDLQMPEMDGMEVLGRLRQDSPELAIVILTAYGTIERAVEAMRLGAYDFLPKPCKPDHILLVVEKALNQKGLREENRYLRDELHSQYRMVIGQSAEMKRVMEVAQQVARSNTTVLIGGESGTGKQLLARAIHTMSNRQDKPFVQVNCTTLSEQLLESDLFGHEKGAFTGAHQMKRGRVELAHRGTMFLDEIGDLTPSIQAKLLHYLEHNEFVRVGGMKTLQVDVRTVAATNKNLAQEVKEGRFRKDLYYRIKVVTIDLPPLRERRCDIRTLCDHFIQTFDSRCKKKIRAVSDEALEVLSSYDFPGNIRELENVIEHAFIFCQGDTIEIEHLPPELQGEREEGDVARTITGVKNFRELEKLYIEGVLEETGGNKTLAAKRLGIHKATLFRKVKQLGIGQAQ